MRPGLDADACRWKRRSKARSTPFCQRTVRTYVDNHLAREALTEVLRRWRLRPRCWHQAPPIALTRFSVQEPRRIRTLRSSPEAMPSVTDTLRSRAMYADCTPMRSLQMTRQNSTYGQSMHAQADAATSKQTSARHVPATL